MTMIRARSRPSISHVDKRKRRSLKKTVLERYSNVRKNEKLLLVEVNFLSRGLSRGGLP